ncbi:hypothetical protein DXG01_012097 [Tephrocybe rancida]|nr:hypothetical protein DXG01_012097 [Tephrocybe rancida]
MTLLDLGRDTTKTFGTALTQQMLKWSRDLKLEVTISSAAKDSQSWQLSNRSQICCTVTLLELRSLPRDVLHMIDCISTKALLADCSVQGFYTRLQNNMEKVTSLIPSVCGDAGERLFWDNGWADGPDLVVYLDGDEIEMREDAGEQMWDLGGVI